MKWWIKLVVPLLDLLQLVVPILLLSQFLFIPKLNWLVMEVSQEFRGWPFSASSGGLLGFSSFCWHYLSCRSLSQKLSASIWIVWAKKAPLKPIITEYCNVSSKLNTSDIFSKGEPECLQRHSEILFFFFFQLVCRNFSFWKWKSIIMFKSIGSYLVSWLFYGHIKFFLLLIQWISFPSVVCSLFYWQSSHLQVPSVSILPVILDKMELFPCFHQN